MSAQRHADKIAGRNYRPIDVSRRLRSAAMLRFDITQWRERLGLMEGKVCRIEGSSPLTGVSSGCGGRLSVRLKKRRVTSVILFGFLRDPKFWEPEEFEDVDKFMADIQSFSDSLRRLAVDVRRPAGGSSGSGTWAHPKKAVRKGGEPLVN